MPADQGGSNYATSGAKNVTINTVDTGGFMAAVPTVTQISNYLAASGGQANSNAIYLISSGGNDVSYALGNTGNSTLPRRSHGLRRLGREQSGRARSQA